MKSSDTLISRGIEIIHSPRPADKVALSRVLASDWRNGGLTLDAPGNPSPPDRPARPAKPELRRPRDMPKRSTAGDRGKGALLHALAHIELNAIDLAWDIIARFVRSEPLLTISSESAKSFCDDWVEVADEEAKHFELLAERLRHVDLSYGDLPAHDGLWEAAQATSGDLLARLAVVPLVLEARGLDVTPDTVKRLRSHGHEEDAAVLDVIYQDEIKHVRTGVTWFSRLAEYRGMESEIAYRELVNRYFKGRVQGPFNVSARDLAGFGEQFYGPLAAKR